MTRLEQKNEEMNIAKFFIERLNLFYSLDYLPESNEDESGEYRYTDVFAHAQKNQPSTLYLQLITCDGDLHQVNAENQAEVSKKKKRIQKTGIEEPLVSSVRSVGGNIIDPIKYCLEKKSLKNSGRETLVIYYDFPFSTWDPEGAKRLLLPLINDTSFPGVFLVIPPAPKKETSNFSHEGQVIALKNTFGPNGQSF